MKLIATDLDGTLLNENGEISQENAQALLKAQQLGIKVVVATGRSYRAALKPLEATGLDCPIICLNGANIYSNKGEIVRSIPLTMDICKSIQTICQENDIYFELFTNQGVYSTSREKFIKVMVDILTSANPELDEEEIRSRAEQRFQDEEFIFTNDFDNLYSTKGVHVFKILAFSLDKQNLNSVHSQLEKESELAITSSGFDNLEFNHSEAKKGIALQTFAEDIGIDMKDVMAIGDNFNDLSMLQMAGRGVAMGNAEDEIKQACSYTTKTNLEHGVAYAIEEMLMEINA